MKNVSKDTFNDHYNFEVKIKDQGHLAPKSLNTEWTVTEEKYVPRYKVASLHFCMSKLRSKYNDFTVLPRNTSYR